MLKFTQKVAVGIFTILGLTASANAEQVNLKTMVKHTVLSQINETKAQIEIETHKSIQMTLNNFNHVIRPNRVIIRDLKVQSNTKSKSFIIAQVTK
ncbi:hypothetical protein CJF42_01680 [Pseudoalteromonas sp. NBT06-2]|uniref:hypothetical protein n=1 Tax=Pseudoalteromonas sp. NBT06-2 TaxID=2025950 RepID=UPI000BA5219D|nr:hypothetical protein [Pseudoalteromonas sp. NBT06-2]PAJ75974.1 hypothetical protein CJF42_01680 [Pseudoalteromonas sp. NBT06-2]